MSAKRPRPRRYTLAQEVIFLKERVSQLEETRKRDEPVSESHLRQLEGRHNELLARVERLEEALRQMRTVLALVDALMP